MPAQRIMTQYFLNLQRQARKALPHVGVAGRKPYAYASRNRDHRRTRTDNTRASAVASTPLSTTTRCPQFSTISIRPDAATKHSGDVGVSAPLSCSGKETALLNEPSSPTKAAANRVAATASPRRPSRANRRQLNNWLADRP